ncbi:MAG: hypothetical protein IJF13_03255 [Clostridia bacterium]|nr:hypothetical protein [Clostridia bacterium]
MKQFLLSGIKVPVTLSHSEIVEEAKKMFFRISREFCNFRISKLSVDARRRDSVKYVVSVLADHSGRGLSESVMKKHGLTAVLSPQEPKLLPADKETAPPVIVGFGPAGMFSALLLAEAGYRPIVLERGGSVEERVKAVERFNSEGVLSPDSNIQFGAGGAGTFSDGKLVTRINDGFCSYVLRRLIEFGAPAEIAYLAKPHIGTDKLLSVVGNIEKKIKELGGTVLYNSKMVSIETSAGTAKRVVLSDGRKIGCSAVILAVGHSARDTYEYLIDDGYSVEAKPFSVGVRIEHLQEDIDSAMFGRFAGLPGVPHAEYTLSHRCADRGVYTFCMCPGGEVVAAASEESGVVTNGMSRYSRSGKNANAAVAVSVVREDYGGTPRGAIAFQRNIERAAFRFGGGDYTAPAQTVGDFLGNSVTGKGTSYISPTYMNGKVKYCGFDGVLPAFITDCLREGIADFGKKIAGFDREEAVLTGPETRTSAPVRILRNEEYCAIGYDNIYPAGEGAGYAGGITSAAIDGLKIASALSLKYGKKDKA